MADHQLSEAPNAGLILDQVWRDLPYLPRAVALLIYFMEADEAVSEMLAAGQAELAAEVLADCYPVRAAFEATYGIEWEAARDLFSRATAHSVAHPHVTPGDQIVYGVTTRMLTRLGYIDGLVGAREAPPSNLDEKALTPPAPKSEFEAREAAAARSVSNDVLYPAYQAGFTYGIAAAYLAAHQPDLVQAIDDRALVLLEAGAEEGAMIGRELAEVVQAREDDLEMNHIEAGLQYAEGRWGEIREIRARRAVQRYLKTESEITPVAAASVLRVLGHETRRVTMSEQVDRQDELDEALVVAATLGFLPDTAEELLAPIPPGPVTELVTRHSRDYAAAATARTVLDGLAVPPAGSRLMPNPRTGAQPREATAFAFTSETSARALVLMLQNGQRGGEAFESVKALRARLHRMEAPAAAAGALLAQHVLARASSDLPADPMVFIRLEVAATQPVGETLWDHLEHRLLRMLAASAATSLLAAWDDAAARRSRAEAELARRGRDAEADLAEGWVRTYRSEAAAMGADRAMLSWITTLPREAAAAEGVLLLARARVVEEALEVRAWRAAQAEVARQIPVIGHNVYASDDAESVILEVFQVAAFQAIAEAERKVATRPRFGPRVVSYLPAAALEALAIEIGVLEELRAREAA